MEPLLTKVPFLEMTIGAILTVLLMMTIWIQKGNHCVAQEERRRKRRGKRSVGKR